jgi:hypothetical protein
MRVHKYNDLAKKKLSPEQRAENRAWVEQELLEMDLRAVRELVGVTQEELARVAQMTQAEVSRTERRGDHRLSTLRRIIQALGGDLEVIAHFGDKTVRLHGV